MNGERIFNGGQHQHSALLEGEDLGAVTEGVGGGGSSMENEQYLEFASLLGEGTYAHAAPHSLVQGGASTGGPAARRPNFLGSADPFSAGSEQVQTQGAPSFCPSRETPPWGASAAGGVCKTEPVVSPSGEDTASHSSGGTSRGFVPPDLGGGKGVPRRDDVQNKRRDASTTLFEELDALAPQNDVVLSTNRNRNRGLKSGRTRVELLAAVVEKVRAVRSRMVDGGADAFGEPSRLLFSQSPAAAALVVVNLQTNQVPSSGSETPSSPPSALHPKPETLDLRTCSI